MCKDSFSRTNADRYSSNFPETGVPETAAGGRAGLGPGAREALGEPNPEPEAKVHGLKAPPTATNERRG